MTARLWTLGALGLVAGLSILAATPAQAATYPPLGGVTVTVDTTSPVVGGFITITGEGFAPASDVVISATSSTTALGTTRGGAGRIGTAKSDPITCTSSLDCTVAADAQGVATASMQVMSVGPLTITIKGVDAASKAVTRTVTINVISAAAGSGAPTTGLVRTGAGRSLQLVEVGIAFLLLGSVVALTVRRRREHAALL